LGGTIFQGAPKAAIASDADGQNSFLRRDTGALRIQTKKQCSSSRSLFFVFVPFLPLTRWWVVCFFEGGGCVHLGYSLQGGKPPPQPRGGGGTQGFAGGKKKCFFWVATGSPANGGEKAMRLSKAAWHLASLFLGCPMSFLMGGGGGGGTPVFYPNFNY